MFKELGLIAIGLMLPAVAAAQSLPLCYDQSVNGHVVVSPSGIPRCHWDRPLRRLCATGYHWQSGSDTSYPLGQNAGDPCVDQWVCCIDYDRLFSTDDASTGSAGSVGLADSAGATAGSIE